MFICFSEIVAHSGTRLENVKHFMTNHDKDLAIGGEIMKARLLINIYQERSSYLLTFDSIITNVVDINSSVSFL